MREEEAKGECYSSMKYKMIKYCQTLIPPDKQSCMRDMGWLIIWEKKAVTQAYEAERPKRRDLWIIYLFTAK